MKKLLTIGLLVSSMNGLYAMADSNRDLSCARIEKTFYNLSKKADYKGTFPMVHPLRNRTDIPNDVHQLLSLLARRYDCTLSVVYYCDTGEYLVTYTDPAKQSTILERLSEAGFTCEVETSYRKGLIRRLAQAAQSFKGKADASAASAVECAGDGDDA